MSIGRTPVVASIVLVAGLGVFGQAPLGPVADARSLIDRGRYDDAEVAAESGLQTLLSAQNPDAGAVDNATDLLVRTLILNGKTTAPRTRALAEQVVLSRERRGTAGGRELPVSLMNLGDALVETAEFSRAIAILERAAALIEAREGADSRQFAESLDHLGTALTLSGRSQDALRQLERSLRIKEASLDDTRWTTARTLEGLGLALQRQGDYAKAGTAIRRAVSIQEQLDVTHPAYAEALTLLGLQAWFEGDLQEAVTAASQSVALAERTLRPDHPTIAKALRYQAGAYLDSGDLILSRQLLERALAIAERSLGPTHADMWKYPNDLAGPVRMLGDYPTARTLLEQSLRTAQAKFGEQHDSVATSVHNLALVDASLGDYTLARREQLRAARIWENLLGRNHPFVAIALIELATLYREQGEPLQAVPLLQRALAIRETRLGPTHPDVARTLSDLAATLMQLGAVTRAEVFAGRALRIAETLESQDSPDVATVYGVWASVKLARGNYSLAREYYLKSLAIRTKALGRAHSAIAEAEIGLAQAEASGGDYGPAFSMAFSGETNAREHLRLMLTALPERQALTYAATRPRGIDLMLSLADISEEAAAQAVDAVIRSRALVLDEMASRHATLPSVSGDTPRLRAAFLSSQQRFANLVIRGQGTLSAAQYRTTVEAAEQARERAELDFAEQNARFKLQRTLANTGLSDVQSALPAGTALISIFRYQRFQPGDPSATGGPAPARRVAEYVAAVLAPNGAPEIVRLGRASTIDGLVSKWRRDVFTDATQPRPAGTPPAARVSGGALRRHIWDPLARHLDGATRVFLVPDGSLTLVSFVGLPVGRTGYLLEHAPVIHYLSAERDLVRTLNEPRTAATRLLAVGGPAFNTRASVANGERSSPPAEYSAPIGRRQISGHPCQDLQSMRFQPLGGTLEEVKEIATRWNGQQFEGRRQAAVLIGAEADERAFKERAPGSNVLHLATHGFFLGGPCVSEEQGTRAVGGLVRARSSQRPITQNPLLLSGLALAGANQRLKAGLDEDDGILTAEEVASLELSSVDWAVLSACDTGLGQVRAGEGVFGLRRAFQIAGARTVVMSLWSVDDRATRAWMTRLYEGRFERNLSTAEAVQAASLTVLRERRERRQRTDPFYWAGFVASGDWR
jgi:CHAT domain-containing protein